LVKSTQLQIQAGFNLLVLGHHLQISRTLAS
jgi:hypothetical protein